ncbi:MAG: TonB-dependent receptor [Dysgonamonadaceae bacterium]|jgi:TonB-linked SusC/RagA family outer membrane protein|nr:TonB-dependent receptor [Dysgonamonadaceae bacterium]
MVKIGRIVGVCMLWLFALSAYAQQTLPLIKGIVFDNTGETLIGASITVKNTKQGTATGIDGYFQLANVASNAVLEISYLGCKTKSVSIDGKTEFKIILDLDDNVLQEIVVTGYGTFKKSAYAGSASVMNGNKLDVPGVSITDALQGNVTGVSVSSGGSSVPGAPQTVRIRGVGSFNASSSPLYVIDGVPVISGDVSVLGSLSSNNAGLDILTTLNPDDIENIAVIKDASAAALYGSRAANGIIAITTKSGKKGKAVFALKAETGYTDFAMPFRSVLDGKQRADMIAEGLHNEWSKKGGAVANAANYTGEDDYVAKNLAKYAPEPWSGWTDWDKVLFRAGNFSNYDLSLTGGNDAGAYYAAVNYTNQDGTSPNSGLSRISGRLNADFNVNKKFKFGVKLLGSRLNQDVYGEGTEYTSPFYSSRRAVTPSDAVMTPEGDYNHTFVNGSDRNPKLSMDYDTKTEKLTRFFVTPYIEYEIIDGLKLKSTYSFDYNMSVGNTWSDPRTSNGKSSNGSATKYIREYATQLWSNTASYAKRIGDHNFDALYAFELQTYDTDFLSGNKTNYIIPDLNSVGLGGTIGGVNGYPSAWRMATPLILRGNYDYKSKYFAGFSYRYDGSSRLSYKTRWGSFWSISGAYRIIDEQFMQSLLSVISNLRLRASYGTNGNQPTNYYGYYPLGSISSSFVYQGISGIAADQLKNDYLGWEKNHNLNIGLDLGLFNKINISFEYYNRITKDLLLDLPQSATTGFTSHLGNIGKIRNRGVEFEITSKNIDIPAQSFSWTTGFNIGRNFNKILTLDGIQTQIANGSNMTYLVGNSYYTYYLYEFAGIDPEDGEAMFYKNTQDSDGNIIDRATTKKYAEASRIPYKSPEPKASGGLSNTLKYKLLDLSFLFTYQFGGYSYDNGAQKLDHGGGDIETNIPSYYSGRWQNPGDITDIERFVANRGSESMAGIASTRRIHSTDFIRLKNLTLGLSLPKQWLKAVKLEQVRFFASGSNLWTWAKWDWYDPEAASTTGYVEWTQPPLKTATIGLNIKF